MELHDFLDDELRDNAVAFVLDTLGADEARLYRMHLAQCDVCRVEVESLARSARDLALLAPEKAPPPELWQRVLARVRRTDPRTQADASLSPAQNSPQQNSPQQNVPAAGSPAEGIQIWKQWASESARAAPDFTFRAAGDGSDFQPTNVAGIEARRLFVDAENDRVTMIVRMQAGTSYPAHIHGAAEECYVLAGDLTVGTLAMKAGDYQRADVGTVHPVQSTERGCVLLLVSSQHDELI